MTLYVNNLAFAINLSARVRVQSQIDSKILDVLQRDARVSNAELAYIVCLSPSPCSRRVKLLEEHGFLKGRVAIVDPVRVGLAVNVFIQVSLEQPVKKTLHHFDVHVSEWPEVMECYLMTGDYDYLLRVVVPDLESYQRFLDERLTGVKGVSSIRSSFSLKRVQYRTALPLNLVR